MDGYTFTFKSAFNGKVEYELHHGRDYCGRVVSMPSDATLARYSGKSFLPTGVIVAFNAYIERRRLEALAKYPDQADESWMQRRVYRAA